MTRTISISATVLLVITVGVSGIIFLRGLGEFSDKGSNVVPIRLSVAPFQDTLLPIIGAVKGWYQEEGLDVEIKLLPWYSGQEALASGAVDVGVGNIASVIGAHHNFPENVYFYGWNTFDNGFAIMIRPDSDMKTFEELVDTNDNYEKAVIAAARQLKNKTIVTTSRTDMEQVVAYIIRRAGMEFEHDVNIIDMEPEEGLAAFLGGTGDAYVGGIPQRVRALKEGYRELLSGPYLGSSEINGFVTTRGFADRHEDELLKLQHVMFRIIQYTNDNIEESAAIITAEMNKNTGGNFTVEDFIRFWNNYEHYTATPEQAEKMILNHESPMYWKRRWDDTNYYFLEVAKSIPEPVDPDVVFWMPSTHESYLKRF